MKTIQEIIEKSLNHEGENTHHDCDIELMQDGRLFKAYEVSICNRDVLFFCDIGTISYVVDSYGDNNLLSFINYELDE